MYQSFSDSQWAGDRSARLSALRERLAGAGLDGFVVPRADAFQGEYVPASAERLAWLTGFTGSAGFAVVLRERAAVFVDGRYRLQAREQVCGDLFEVCDLIAQPPWAWAGEHLGKGEKLGFDPRLLTIEESARFSRAVAAAGAELVAHENLVDAIWTDRPAPPSGAARGHDLAYAGEASGAKRERTGAAVRARGAAAAVLSAPESVAWLLNMRGSDVPHVPHVLCCAILHGDGKVDLFLEGSRVADAVRRGWGGGVRVKPPVLFEESLRGLGGQCVLVSRVGPDHVRRVLEAGGARIIFGEDPCVLPRACKNPVEVAGARRAHEWDGAALSKFLCWLSGQAAGSVDEISAVRRLEGFRRESAHLQDISFDTIAGSGLHGAVVHYRVTESSNRVLSSGELFLVDSGGQYFEGTTDVTRTVAIGVPSEEMRDRFTRVLRGHMSLARARFPAGTSGAHLDVLARGALWEAGLDFDHGTGHGVGSYLSVHEGPQHISRRGFTELHAGMILSNEPGYYKEGCYGIRIENLMAVSSAEQRLGEERALLSFETLTLAPIDLSLVAVSQLTAAEKDWLNVYHARVRARLTPLLDGKAAAWLAKATREI